MSLSELELQQVRERELDLKRITGEISCAECRRLKLRCDKKIPCCSCIRRGYKNICPTGTSTGSRVSRVIANVALHSNSSSADAARLAAMSERIRALEDALQIATDSTHPLLSPELLSIKRYPHNADSSKKETRDLNTEEERGLENAFGTLTINEGKSMQFLGATASENLLLMNVFDSTSELSRPDLSQLPPELAQLAEMWPFVPTQLSRKSRFYQLGTCLPPFERVKDLKKVFFSRPTWFTDRAQFEEEIVVTFYPEGKPLSPALLDTDKMHDLALLFMVLASGVLIEKRESFIDPEAERYQYLARTALSLNSIFGHGSLSACQTLILLGSYEIHVGRKAAPESSWKLANMAMVLAASIGLHRDPTHWNLDVDLADRRRWMFWELFTLDKWKCLGSGRPSFFPAHAVDCEFPADKGITLEDGTRAESVRQWKYRFTRDVLCRLADQFSSARPQKYSEIINLDRLVRDFDVHPLVSRSLEVDFSVEQLSLHPLFSLWWKERALLYVHRNFFARAVLEHGDDPMRSPYALSFLAAFRSSVTMLKTARLAFDRSRSGLKWHSQFWAMTLSAALVIASVASRTSRAFSTTAANEFERAISLFGESDHPVAKHGLATLLKLHDKANSASSKSPSDSSAPSPCSSSGSAGEANNLEYNVEDDEELHAMRGTTRRIERQTAARKLDVQKNLEMPAVDSPLSPTSFNGTMLSGLSTSTNALGPLADGIEPGAIPSSIPSTTNASDRLLLPMDQSFSPPIGEAATPNSHILRPFVENSFPIRPGLEESRLLEQPNGTSQLQPAFAELCLSFPETDMRDFFIPLDRVYEDVFSAEYSNGVFPTPCHPEGSSRATNYSPFNNTSPAFSSSSGTTSQPAFQLSSSFNGPHTGSNAASSELWQSFLQELDSLGETDPRLQNWDAMEFA